jgi:hypothetical protein
MSGHDHPHHGDTASPSGVPEAPVIDLGPGSGPPDALVLDIGEDEGALILYTDEALIGMEIDITLGDEHQHHGIHTAIRRRRGPRGDVICGVYPRLAAGTYTVWGLNHEAIASADIVGGQVTELHGGDCRTPKP